MGSRYFRAPCPVGAVFNRWTVLSEAGTNPVRWLCKCSCGTEKVVRATSVKTGNIKSCGCLPIDKSFKHGMTGTNIHARWVAMRARCNNKGSSGYERYGGRGIKVCDRWNSFELFYQDMGLPPSPEHSIERIDNNGDYSPENCRWATRREQQGNTRFNKHVWLDGERVIVSEAARRLGITPASVRKRIATGKLTASAQEAQEDKT